MLNEVLYPQIFETFFENKKIRSRQDKSYNAWKKRNGGLFGNILKGMLAGGKVEKLVEKEMYWKGVVRKEDTKRAECYLLGVRGELLVNIIGLAGVSPKSFDREKYGEIFVYYLLKLLTGDVINADFNKSDEWVVWVSTKKDVDELEALMKYVISFERVCSNADLLESGERRFKKFYDWAKDIVLYGIYYVIRVPSKRDWVLQAERDKVKKVLMLLEYVALADDLRELLGSGELLVHSEGRCVLFFKAERERTWYVNIVKKKWVCLYSYVEGNKKTNLVIEVNSVNGEVTKRGSEEIKKKWVTALNIKEITA